MNGLQRPLKALLTAAAILQLAACSKTVQWEEEVLLNTGETIWISKTVRYSIGSESGNPADIGYRPDDVEVTSFKYGGRSYTYTGEAGLMVLAISPRKFPVLLAPPENSDWYRHNDYKCATPHYVQLVPDGTGKQWTWPSQIEPWTYNLPANLLLDRGHPSGMKSRYTMADKSKQTYLRAPRLLSIQKIDPTYTSTRCNRSH